MYFLNPVTGTTRSTGNGHPSVDKLVTVLEKYVPIWTYT